MELKRINEIKAMCDAFPETLMRDDLACLIESVPELLDEVERLRGVIESSHTRLGDLGD